MIPYENLKKANAPFEESFEKAFRRVVSSGIYSGGAECEAFEREFPAALGLGHAAGTGNGYDAIALALSASGLTSGEVIVPSNTYMATALAVVRAGLTPVFAEPDPSTLLLDPADAEKRFTRKTVGIIPVHLFGLSCDMGKILGIARDRGLKVIEDCAQAHGASFSGRSAGSFGDAGCWSFYPTKTLGALGDAGAVTSGSPELVKKVKILRNYGTSRRGWAEAAGLNSRMDELQAAFLREKLKALEEIVAQRNAICRIYDENLPEELVRPAPVKGSIPARSVYPVLHPRRDELIVKFREAGIGCSVHYPHPPYAQPALKMFARGSYPASDLIHARTVSLPFSTSLTEDEIGRVIDAAKRFTGASRPASARAARAAA